MQESLLDFAEDDTSAGFRIHKFEVLNWGTFSHKKWDVDPNGHSSLVTGDIGSGKTTLVDGIASLLVPPGKMLYNKSASSDDSNTKERSLYSYIRGEYKKMKGENSEKGEAVYLRTEDTYSVLLGHFYNEGFSQKVTLAQVYSIRNHKAEAFYVISTDFLSILPDFADFGKDIKSLKDRLNKFEHTKVYSAFSEYSSRFRQIFGGLTEEAILLFRDTIFTKQIRDLTSFVRSLMLEKSEETEDAIKDLSNNFDNLNQSYNAVIKAKEQISMLKPIVSNGAIYTEQEQSLAVATNCRKAAPSYFARFSKTLQEAQIAKTGSEIEKTTSRITGLKDNIVKLRQSERSLNSNIDAAGGGLLKDLGESSSRLEIERDRKKLTHDSYQACLEQLKLPSVLTEAEFFTTRSSANQLFDEIEDKRVKNDHEIFEAKLSLNEASTNLVAVSKDIDAIKNRKSNIQPRSLTIRSSICEALKISEEDLPFIGELIQVNEQEKEWRGAIERVLHNFGLSLLVSDNLYSKVSSYVDQTNLRGKIVYFRVRKDDVKKRLREVEANSLVGKLDIRHESGFSEYLSGRLNDLYSSYICCRTIEEFRKHEYAVTINGQIKSGNNRHEKDDRKSITDDKEYILGWNNKDKMLALEKQLDKLFSEKNGLDKKVGGLEKLSAEIRERRDVVKRLVENYLSYNDIDWKDISKEIEAIHDKIKEITASSNLIETLNKQLGDVTVSIIQDESELLAATEKIGGLNSSLITYKELLAKTLALITQEFESFWANLDELAKEKLPTTKYTLDNIDRLEKELARTLDTEIDRWKTRIGNIRDRIISGMTDYRRDNTAETNDFDASIGSLGEFTKILTRLEEEDLPRHLSNFRSMLREQTINGLALLGQVLDKNKDDIVKRIGYINTSLRGIEYNPGRYIELIPDRHFDRDIMEFNTMVKDCLYGAFGNDGDLYNEDRFCKVRDIVVKLRAEKKWADKVTDVRNWFTFSARETVREDGSEWETYDDTSGKSGGQKEKLAYTILASALAYQFNLVWGEKTSKSFRFVAIDEAFGRGSEESTRYGLELFKKLNLQFLIITPLQKINIIENYVKTIHYVFNPGGNNSGVRNMSIEAYRSEKEKILAMSKAAKVNNPGFEDDAE